MKAIVKSDSVRVCLNGAPDRPSLSEGLNKLAGLLVSGAPSTVRFRAAISEPLPELHPRDRVRQEYSRCSGVP